MRRYEASLPCGTVRCLLLPKLNCCEQIIWDVWKPHAFHFMAWSRTSHVFWSFSYWTVARALCVLTTCLTSKLYASPSCEFFFDIFIVWGWVPECVPCAMCMQCSGGPKEGARSPGPGVTDIVSHHVSVGNWTQDRQCSLCQPHLLCIWDSGLSMGRQSNAPLMPLAGWLLCHLWESLTTRFLEHTADQDFSVLCHCNSHPVCLEKTIISFKNFMILPA